MTTQDRINELEAQITVLRARQDELKKQLRDAEVERWQARIDDVQLQIHLAAMETSDRVRSLNDDLRHRWAEARAKADLTSEAASEGMDAVSQGIRDAYRDLKQAMLDAKKKVAS